MFEGVNCSVCRKEDEISEPSGLAGQITQWEVNLCTRPWSHAKVEICTPPEEVAKVQGDASLLSNEDYEIISKPQLIDVWWIFFSIRVLLQTNINPEKPNSKAPKFVSF
jgi:hypothetical protein